MKTYTFENLENELRAYESMSETEACEYYNVDYKEEARQYIIDYWTLAA